MTESRTLLLSVTLILLLSVPAAFTIPDRYLQLYRDSIRRFSVGDDPEGAARNLKKPRLGTMSRFMKLVRVMEQINSDPTLPFTAGINPLFLEGEDIFNANLGLNLTEEMEHESSFQMTEKRLGQFINKPLPRYVDWRTAGTMGPVKSQGVCGSCWAFAATGVLENSYYLATGRRLSLSEQELVDCVYEEYHNNGCYAGGTTLKAIGYVIRHGISSVRHVPYVAQDRICNHGNSENVLRDVDLSRTRIHFVSKRDRLLQWAVSKRAVAVAIHMGITMIPYKQGLYEDFNTCSSNRFPNHAVTLAGYGTLKNGRPYWLIKNSFGVKWGYGGYLYLSRRYENTCNINEHAYHVELKPVGGETFSPPNPTEEVEEVDLMEEEEDRYRCDDIEENCDGSLCGITIPPFHDVGCQRTCGQCDRCYDYLGQGECRTVSCTTRYQRSRCRQTCGGCEHYDYS